MKTHILFLLSSVLCLTSQAVTSVSKFGITWRFNADYPAGQYADGDYYVVAPSGLTIVGITGCLYAAGIYAKQHAVIPSCPA